MSDIIKGDLTPDQIITQAMTGMLTAQATVISLLIGALEENGSLVPGVVIERLGLTLNATQKALADAGKASDPQQAAIVTFTGVLYAAMSDMDRLRRGAKLSG